jgi:hypothetical protein
MLTIVPDPTNPQQFNRYSYVLNNPIVLVDPTGHFSEGAIWGHIYSDICATDLTCTYDTLASWQQDTEWWEMLLAAEAGDILFGSYGLWSQIKDGAFAFVFMGSGTTLLSGIGMSDMFGNGANTMLPNAGAVNLQMIFQGRYTVGNQYMLNHEQVIRLTWGGTVRELANGDHEIFPRGVNWSNTFYYTDAMERRDTLIIGTTTSVVGSVIVAKTLPLSTPVIVSYAVGGGIGTAIGMGGASLWQSNGRKAGDYYLDVGTNRFVIRPGWANRIIDFR